MKFFKLDKSRDIQAGITALLGPNKEEILYTFEVVPIDYRVQDLSTPKIFLTQSKLFVTYDEALEMYELANLEVESIGASPRFTLLDLFLEGSYVYSGENQEQLRILRTDDVITRIAIAQPNTVPKDFVLRAGQQVQKSFKTWAMGRIIMNTKLASAPNKVLEEMLTGYLSVLNQKTVISFIGAFLVYFVLKPIALNFLPGFVNSILDVGLAAVLIFMLWWLYMTATNNLNRFKTLYLSYKA